MTDYSEIAARFARDTADHQMTVLHEDGLYRHLRFRQPQRNSYWFDLVTWPGVLHVRGDFGRDSYTFTRLTDMFEFFRSKDGINAHYWGEKLDGGRDSVREYSEDAFRQIVRELFVDAVRYSDAPAGLGKAVRTYLLDYDLSDETEARRLLGEFEFKGFQFRDTWEFTFDDWDWSFLWACHAIQWGIAQYDAVKAAPKAVAT
ncbi:hypothetical protein [Streptomyces sp. NPDC096033]|uniref:hypothetical protein n=1 Tax=Streptomyces sp. NPDC096033 TaxID=3366071 RepID=UPI00381CD068